MDGDLNIIIGLATTKVDLGRQLIANVAELGEIDGVARIREQINEEINVLLNAIHNGVITITTVKASKLLHLQCLVKILLKCRGLTSVTYILPDEGNDDRMRIDIVCGNGGCFVNVEAKNLYTFNRNIQDPPPNGHLRILNQAEEFVEAATRSTDVPKPPQICLIFNSEPQEQINKGQLDSGLLDFVQSIVRMDDTNNQCELHLSNTHQSEILQLQTLPCPDNNKYNLPEYKNVHHQPRRIDLITVEMSKKHRTKMPIYQTIGPDTLIREYCRTGPHDVYNNELPNKVIAVERKQQSYSESSSYFCASCKTFALAYEQEILKLREELNQKESIINTLKKYIEPVIEVPQLLEN